MSLSAVIIAKKMKRYAVVLMALATCLLAQEPAQSLPLEEKFVPGQVIVRFKKEAGQAQLKDAMGKGGLRVRKLINTARVKAKGDPEIILAETDMPVGDAIAKLKGHPAVEFAEPNLIYKHQALPSDAYFTDGSLWGLYGDSTVPSNEFGSQASKAWSMGYTGTNSVYVGIIDEGVQWQHPDLNQNIWTNQFENPNDGIDNDQNGYVDDVHGWDFFNSTNSVFDSSGDNHGTHVAGTIGGAANNGGIVGVNWRVTYIPAKFLGPDGGALSDAIEAIYYLTDLKVRHGLNIVAINNSWAGGVYSQALHDAIIVAAKAEILFVAAAGNGVGGVGINNDLIENYPSNYDTTRGTTTEPRARYNSVIAVAAIDKTGALASFSNYGSKTVHLGAPGVKIWSTVPPNSYASYNGTSMATPHVTGAIALYSSTHPGQTALQIRTALLNAVKPTASLVNKTTTQGRLNLSDIIIPPASLVTNQMNQSVELSAVKLVTNKFTFSIIGSTNQLCDIQSSTNLTNWVTLVTMTNTTGKIDYSELLQTNLPTKFYRIGLR